MPQTPDLPSGTIFKLDWKLYVNCWSFPCPGVVERKKHPSRNMAEWLPTKWPGALSQCQVNRNCRLGPEEWLASFPVALNKLYNHTELSLNIHEDPTNSTSPLVYSEGKKAFLCDRAWQSHVLENWVVIPWLLNQFGLLSFKPAIWEDNVLSPVILQLFRMLLEISPVELPASAHVVSALHNDGNEAWRISVRPGVPVVPLVLCPWGRWLMSQMNH